MQLILPVIYHFIYKHLFDYVEFLFYQAAAHIHRFLSLDENVLRMSADASEGQ